MTTRTPEQITARIRVLRAGGTDPFGFREELLLEAVGFDHAREFLPPDLTAPVWDQQRWSHTSDTETYARWYLQFAIDKMLAHRSNSASRSIDKLAELAWLLGRDDIASAMETAGYPMYGAPMVKAFADGLGWPFTDAVDNPDDRQALTRMANGQPCNPDGCRSCGG